MTKLKRDNDTFADYREKKQTKRELLIRGYLDITHLSRANFKFITDLAKMVAAHLSQVEGRNCSPSTLLRNIRYKVLLEKYQEKSVLPGAKNVSIPVIDEPRSAAVVTQLKLVNRNLTSENQRLKAHIASLKAGQKIAQSCVVVGVSPETNDFEEKFILTCQAMLRLFEKFDELLRVDTDANRIIDLEPRPHRVLVDERFATPYIEWLLANKTRQ